MPAKLLGVGQQMIFQPWDKGRRCLGRAGAGRAACVPSWWVGILSGPLQRGAGNRAWPPTPQKCSQGWSVAQPSVLVRWWKDFPAPAPNTRLGKSWSGRSQADSKPHTEERAVQSQIPEISGSQRPGGNTTGGGRHCFHSGCKAPVAAAASRQEARTGGWRTSFPKVELLLTAREN